jgi:succinate dehydrogenase/fumarate reductase flavoprotein subunit
MQNSMQINAGVFRIEKTLKVGVQKIDETLEMFNRVGIKDRVILFIML